MLLFRIVLLNRPVAALNANALQSSHQDAAEARRKRFQPAGSEMVSSQLTRDRTEALWALSNVAAGTDAQAGAVVAVVPGASIRTIQ